VQIALALQEKKKQALLRVRLRHAIELIEVARRHATPGAVARGVRFGHEVLRDARGLKLAGRVDEEARGLLDLVLQLSLRLSELERTP